MAISVAQILVYTTKLLSYSPFILGMSCMLRVSEKYRQVLVLRQLWQIWTSFRNFSLLNSERICGGGLN